MTFLRFSWDCDLPRFSWVCVLLEIFLGLWPTWYFPGSLTYLRFSLVCDQYLKYSWVYDLPKILWFFDLPEILQVLWPTWYFPGSVTYLRFSWVCWMGVFWSSVLESWSWNLMSCSLSVVSCSIHDNNFITTVYCHICIMYLIHVFYVLQIKGITFCFCSTWSNKLLTMSKIIWYCGWKYENKTWDIMHRHVLIHACLPFSSTEQNWFKFELLEIAYKIGADIQVMVQKSKGIHSFLCCYNVRFIRWLKKKQINSMFMFLMLIIWIIINIQNYNDF